MEKESEESPEEIDGWHDEKINEQREYDKWSNPQPWFQDQPEMF
jgi:hypothetical protein